MTTSRLRDVARLARMFALALLALAASARASPATSPVVSSDEKTTAPWWRGSSPADPRREGTRGDHHQPLSAVDPSHLAVATAEGVHRPNGAWSVPGWSVAVAPDDDASFRCGDVARVTVTSPAPNASHWIAVYSPARANVTATAPTRYVILHEADPAYLTTGVAVVRVRLVCARADHDVVLFADDWVTRQGWRQDLVRFAVAVARSPRVSVPQADGPRKPRVVVLAPERDDDPDDSATVASASSDLAVAWNSGRDATHTPRLRWWLPGSPQDAVESPATTTTFAREDLCGSPADGVGWRHPGYTHVARIVGAPPGRTVAYELLDDAGGRYPAVDEPNAWLAVPREDDRKTPEDDRTETRPETGGASGGSGGSRASRPSSSSSSSSRYRPFSLAMFADMGRGTDDDSVTWQEYGAPALNVSRALARDAAKGDVDAAFLFGDLSYATGYASVWDDWTEQIAPFAGRVPFLTNPGNHEFDAPPDAWRPRGVPGDVYGGDDSGGECGVPLATFFPTPRKSREASWWSVAAGPFLILSVNAEASLRPGSPQLEWLRRQLAAVDRVATPWVLFAAHRPALVDSDFGAREPAYRRAGGEDYSDVGVALAMQRDVWPLLVDAGVDAAFGGHNHVYQRHCAFDWRTKGDEEGNDGGDGNAKKKNGYAKKNGNANGDGNTTAASVPLSSTWTRGRWPTRETYGEGCVGRPRANADGVSVYDAPRAPVSFVVGSAGAGFTRTATGAAFSEVTAYEYGYLRLVAANRTHLFGEFRETQRGLGTIDRFLIVREETEEEKTGRARLEFANGRRGPRRAGGGTATATVR